MQPAQSLEQKPEMAHVLFMDLVGYSKLPMARQRESVMRLQNLVKATAAFQGADVDKQLIALPTGDGMALVFFGDPATAADCAIEVARTLGSQPDVLLRMGLHTGPVYRVADINTNLGVTGGGINLCQRVMDAGDAGHILVSSTMADVLSQLGDWADRLIDIGEHPVKHGAHLHFFNLSFPGVGRAELPIRFRDVASGTRSSSRRLWTGSAIGALVVVAMIAVMLWSSKKLTVPTASAAPRLSYWITVQRFKDGKPFRDPFRLTHELLFEENFRIAMNFALSEAAYLYVLNDGPLSTGKESINVLYPDASGSAPTAAHSAVRIPRSSWFVFDTQSGPEKLYVVSGRQPAGEIEDLYRLPRQNGLVVLEEPARLAALREWLNQLVVPENAIHRDEKENHTSIVSSNALFAHRITLEHH